MSKRLGQVYFAPKRQAAFLNPATETGGDYSDETAKIIDEEVRRIIDEQYAVVLKILKENRALLEKTAGRLLVDEVIDGPALQDLAKAVRTATRDSARPTAGRRRR